MPIAKNDDYGMGNGQLYKEEWISIANILFKKPLFM